MLYSINHQGEYISSGSPAGRGVWLNLCVAVYLDFTSWKPIVLARSNASSALISTFKVSSPVFLNASFLFKGNLQAPTSGWISGALRATTETSMVSLIESHSTLSGVGIF